MTLVSVDEAARRLAAGQLVAFPTETVYGLGARADDDMAVAGIFAAKDRPSEHPLIVHMAEAGLASSFSDQLDDRFHRLAGAFWPGPLTLIVQRRAGVASASAGGQGSIGLRVPAHPVALALLKACRMLGVPGLAGPSANRFGRLSPTTADHVLAEFGPAMAVLDGGPCAVGIESTIVDLSGGAPALLRPGRLERAVIEAVLGTALAERGNDSPRASGTLEAHYAPGVPLRLFDAAGLRSALAEARRAQPAGASHGPMLAVYSRCALAEPSVSGVAEAGVIWRQMPGDAGDAAHELFAVLRELDAAGVRQIWVETPPEGPMWEGVRDRLRRAAAAAA